MLYMLILNGGYPKLQDEDKCTKNVTPFYYDISMLLKVTSMTSMVMRALTMYDHKIKKH